MSLGDFDLIVTCEECSTSFQLDEARIPVSGAQVRCSRCKHAFFLPNPSAGRPDTVHSIAAQAASAPDDPVPTATQDLGATTLDGPLADPGSEFEAEIEEEDWQFSEEIRIEGDEDLEEAIDEELSADLGAAMDGESAFGESEDFGSELDESALHAEATDSRIETSALGEPGETRSGAGGVSGMELDSASKEPLRDESSFGTVDDFSALIEDEEPAAPVDLAGEIAAELAQEEAADLRMGTDPESGPADDLGDPESWDLVGGDDIALAPPHRTSVSRAFATAKTVDSVDSVETGELFEEDAIG
ncbi:MAG: hypothetical protein CL933_21660, partial [Deltaproteobacteria bacterium]|nr:hypothetical protein [Deltaproteobacteria bacterium]